jgi:hypothetical protein
LQAFLIASKGATRMAININFNGKPWLQSQSTPQPYTPQYEDEKWKWDSLYVLSAKDRQDARNYGLVRETPNPLNLGLEVTYDDVIL